MQKKEFSWQEIYALTAEGMQQTESVMRQEMVSEIPLAELVMRYALGAGGKRFRPMLTLLSAGVCGYHDARIATAAAFIEFIHNATLLHDDVVDMSDMRRGQASANTVFSNAASVLVGDFLYTRAFQLMVSLGDTAVIATMAETTNLIAEGEVMQLSSIGDINMDETHYYRMIELKTAVLFSAACKVAAQLADMGEVQVQALENYGRQLGMAFQIMDDMLDYVGKSEKIGKSLGDDLAESKLTLPLIRAQQQLNKKHCERLREIISTGDRGRIDELIKLLNETDALDYSRMQAMKMVTAATENLSVFVDSDYKSALMFLARAVVEREH